MKIALKSLSYAKKKCVSYFWVTIVTTSIFLYYYFFITFGEMMGAFGEMMRRVWGTVKITRFGSSCIYVKTCWDFESNTHAYLKCELSNWCNKVTEKRGVKQVLSFFQLFLVLFHFPYKNRRLPSLQYLEVNFNGDVKSNLCLVYIVNARNCI